MRRDRCGLHPLIIAAGRGQLPEWACVRARRMSHLAGVAELLGRWAVELGLAEHDRTRWMAAGWLHDSLRDADPQTLAADAGDYPKKLRHGPAVAEPGEASSRD